MLDIDIPQEKLYTSNAASIAAFLGGPLVAAYFIAHNFQLFGNRKAALITWVVSVLLCLLIILSNLFIPFFEKLPGILFPILDSILAGYVVSKLQKLEIDEHMSRGGAFHATWKAALISLGFAILELGLVIGLVVLVDYL